MIRILHWQNTVKHYTWRNGYRCTRGWLCVRNDVVDPLPAKIDHYQNDGRYYDKDYDDDDRQQMDWKTADSLRSRTRSPTISAVSAVVSTSQRVAELIHTCSALDVPIRLASDHGAPIAGSFAWLRIAWNTRAVSGIGAACLARFALTRFLVCSRLQWHSQLG